MESDDAYYPGPESRSLSSSSSSFGMLRCLCLGHCPDGSHNGTCLARPGASCFAAVEEVIDPDTGDLVSERTYGCLPPEDEGGLLQCKGHLVPHMNPTSIACCSDGNLCNRNLFPTYVATQIDDEDGQGGGIIGASLDHTTSIALLISLTVCFVIFIIVVAYVYLHLKRREDNRQKYMLAAQKDPESFVGGHQGTLKDLIEQSSGSGSGLPQLVQRTIAKQITMERSIGKGRYGEVWLAKWRGENIAAKVFFTCDEASWFRETEIYQTALMRHENILGFIAADIKGTGGWTQMLLLTDYHEQGSLYDFLGQNTISTETCLRLCYSLLCGLCHLHMEVTGTEIMGQKGKPAIAHRDIKSRNILVKNDLTCAIADYGLAVRLDREKGEIDVGAANPRVGTIRYMSPENLDETLDKGSFDSFLLADMYSVGLVLWEITRRTISGEKTALCDEHQVPYWEYVNPDPSFEEMHAAVCLKELRPPIPHRFHSDSVLSRLSKLMSECWYANPSARLSALRVKKSIGKIIADEYPESFKGEL